jgi:hypothetical protein
MDNNISPGNNLDKYFSKARNMQPASSLEEVSDLIKNAPVHAKYLSYFSRKQILKHQLIMSSLIVASILCIISFFYYTPTVDKPGNVAKQQASAENIWDQKKIPAVHKFHETKPDCRSARKLPLPYLDLSNPAENLSFNAVLKYDTVSFLYVNPNIHHTSSQNNTLEDNENSFRPFALKDIKPLELDRNHLSKMGFSDANGEIEYNASIKGYCYLHFNNGHESAEFGSNKSLHLFSKNYDFYPAFIADREGESPFVGSDPGVLNVDSFLHVHGKVSDLSYSNYSRDLLLIPVLFRDSSYRGLQCHKDLIFWFKQTPALMAVLNDLDTVSLPVIRINRKKMFVSKVNENEAKKVHNGISIKLLNSNYPYIWNGTKPMEVDKRHMEALGFHLGKHGLDYQIGIKELGYFRYTNHGDTVETYINNLGQLYLPKKDYYPVFITSSRFKVPENIEHQLKEGRRSSDSSKSWTLVPILVKQSDYTSFVEHEDLIFWFKATPAFLRLIHDQGSINAVVVVKPFQNPEAENRPRNIENIETVKLQDIKLLELDEEHLVKLGFFFIKDTIMYLSYIPKHGFIQYFNTKDQVGFEAVETDMELPVVRNIYPAFISETNGFKQYQYDIDNLNIEVTKDEYTASEIRRLVPVLLKGLNKNKDIIFWFSVTPEFLAALPPDISIEMRKEYQQLLKSNNNNASDTASKLSCKYFDVCQLPLERQLKVNIYPNPAQTKLNVDFELGPNTSATISITDLGGKVVKNIDQTYSGTGSQHSEIMVGDLKPGIYLVLLKLSNGVVLNNKVMIRGQE